MGAEGHRRRYARWHGGLLVDLRRESDRQLHALPPEILKTNEEFDLQPQERRGHPGGPLDLPRVKGLPYLEPGTPIYIEDLEAAEKMAGVKVRPGDALFIRTGVWPYREKFGAYARGRNGKAAGLHASVIPWLKQRDPALLSMDQPISVSPSEIPGAVHDFAMVALGIHLIDNSDPEAAAAKAAASKRWEFLLTVAPLPVRGATGSAINPIATF